MVLKVNELYEWRHLSKDGFCTMPWYVKPVLDILNGMDLSKLKVWEWGLGYSTIFYAKYAKEINGVDSNEMWIKNVNDTLLHYSLSSNTYLRLEYEEERYVNAIDTFGNYDIIVIDGLYREACFYKALQVAKEGCLIIFDNWMQPSVEVQSQEVQDEVKKYKHEVFPQEGHDDWKTLLVWK